LPPLERCFGTNPNHAENYLPFLNSPASITAYVSQWPASAS
jgi:hypothetical protein